MTRKDLINRLMTLDLDTVLGILPTKGDLKVMSDTDLAAILTTYDTIKNLQYKVHSLYIRAPRPQMM